MSERPHDESDSGLSEIDRLLLECVEAEPPARPQVLDGLCKKHPPLADELRRRWGLLGEVGFIDAATGETGELQRLCAYRILRRLGGGGMGLVYLAQHEDLGRQVALKVLRPEFAISDRARERFRREGVILSKLEHPGICPVYEAGEAEGMPFLAMRYLEGHTLAELIEAAREQAVSGSVRLATPNGSADSEPGERARIQEILQVFEQIAHAVHAAHEAGLVHRDLKPGNIMITAKGEPVVLDFGLARDAADEVGLTHSGDVLGTPAYLAPEQVQGVRRADARTDVYALGVTLYECLTLVRPFQGGNREALYRQILARDPAAVRTRNRHVPQDLAVVVATAIERSGERRYQTALALAEDLRRVRQREPIVARPASPLLRTWRWSQRNPVLAGFMALLVVGLLGTAWMLGRVQLALEHTQALAVANLAFKVTEREPKAGLWLAVEAWRREDREETRSQIYAALARSHEVRRFWHEPGKVVWSLCWSPGGRRLATASDDGKTKVWDLDHPKRQPIVVEHEDAVYDVRFVGVEGNRLLTTSADGRAGLWSLRENEGALIRWFGERDGDRPVCGTRIATDGRAALLLRQDMPMLVDLETLAVRDLEQAGRIEDGCFSPDGRLAVTAVGYNREEPDASVRFTANVWRVADGELLHELEHPDSIQTACFLADEILLTGSIDGLARRFDVATGSRLDMPIDQGRQIYELAVAPHGGQTLLALGGVGLSNLRLYRFEDVRGAPALLYERPEIGLARDLKFTVDGLIAALYGGTARSFTLEGFQRRVFRGHTSRVQALAVRPSPTPADRQVATAGWDGSVRLWRLDDPALEPLGLQQARFVGASASGLVFGTGRSISLLAGDAAPVEIPHRGALAVFKNLARPNLSPSGALVAYVTREHRVELLTLEGENAGGFTIPSGLRNDRAIYQAAMIGEARVLVASAARLSMRDLDGNPAGLDTTLEGSGLLHAMAVDESRQRIAVGTEDQGAAVLDFEGRLQGPWLGAGPAIDVALSPDGRWLATATGQRAVVYDLEAPEHEPVELPGHEGQVWSVAFAPDPSDPRVLTACDDGSARIWSMDGELWARIETGAKRVWQACWSPDGVCIWTAQGESGLWRWPATTERLLALARERSRPDSPEEQSDYEARLRTVLMR